MKQRHQMALTVVAPFYGEGLYVRAIAALIAASLGKLQAPPEVIIASYHGIPSSYQVDGDPYAFQCEHTTALLRLTFFQQKVGFSVCLNPKPR